MQIGKPILFTIFILLLQTSKLYAEQFCIHITTIPPIKKMEKTTKYHNTGLLPTIGEKILLQKLKTNQINKGTALLILLLTGPLGGHRVYLGTSIYVPLVYTLTIGGGFGLLPIIDAFAIIFTSDLSKFINNDKIIMWIKN